MREKYLFWIIMIGYLIAGIFYATLTPAWQAPDEPAHYNYIRQLADGDFPVIETGDYNQTYQNEVIGSRFAPQFSIEPFEYEDHQPPLYYLVQTPIYWLTNGSLIALRLVSVLLGVGIVWLSYETTRIIFPQSVWLGLVAMAFVAFLPQHVAILASVNNDVLAWLVIAGILYLMVKLEVALLNGEWGLNRNSLIFISLLLGLGLVTKGTVYILVPVLGVWLLQKYWGNWGEMVRVGVWLFLPAFLIGTIWWGRNVALYEGFDIMATGAHDAVVEGQLRTSQQVATHGMWGAIALLGEITFHSFWGQFGWMGVPMPDWVYTPLLLFSILILVGLFIAPKWLSRPQLPKTVAWLLAGTFLFNLILFLGYNLAFVQYQGRYLFGSLIPIGVAVALGGSAWVNVVKQKWEGVVWLMPAFLALALFALDMVALFKFIIPSLG